MAKSTLFPLGRLLSTPGALDAFTASGDEPLPYLARHAAGDWGDLGDEDKALNDRAVAGGGRIFSAYRLSDGTKVWLITEADRSATTFLLPEEY